MVGFLFAVGQFLCVLGLLYGLILTIAHRDCVDTLRAHYDPIAGHDWLSFTIVERTRRPPPAAPETARNASRADAVGSATPCL